MTYFYKCEKCYSQTKIETDDEQFANKRIAHFKKYHNCKGKKHEPIQQVQLERTEFGFGLFYSISHKLSATQFMRNIIKHDSSEI